LTNYVDVVERNLPGVFSQVEDELVSSRPKREKARQRHSLVLQFLHVDVRGNTIDSDRGGKSWSSRLSPEKQDDSIFSGSDEEFWIQS
jgi:hypothetical protein